MPPGRKPRLETDQELAGRIASMVRVGMYPERAALAAGVPESTHYYWQQKGREERDHIAAGKTPRKTWAVYLDYVDLIDQAVAEAEFMALGKIASGGKDWGSQAWILERRFRDRWGSKSAVKIEQPPAGDGAAQNSPVDQLTQRRQQRGKKSG